MSWTQERRPPGPRSTSAGLQRSDTRERFPGSGNEHITITVADGRDIERFLTTLHDHCWLAGLGWMTLGKAGQFLDRSIIDRSVLSPERLVFEAAPELAAPLCQDQALRQPQYFDGFVVDTKTACPSLTPEEAAAVRRLKEEDKRRIQPEAEKVRAAHEADQLPRLMAKGLTEHEARLVLREYRNCLLRSPIELDFDAPELKGATVGDVLQHPDRYLGESLADPIEGREYGGTKAKVLRRPTGEVFIRSFAHGGINYELRQKAPAIPWRFYGDEEAEEERTYLVDKVLPETGAALMSGQWGTYKTFTGLDLAAAVIAGTTFAGFPIVRSGAVLFIALEGQSEVTIRLRAALAHHGFTDERAPFAWIDQCPRLTEQGASAELATMMQPAIDRMRKDYDLPVALIIIDTAGKAAQYARSGEENDAVLNRNIIIAMQEASRATGALFVGIDHFGKTAETGTRGSSAKEADCDAVLALLGEKSMNGTVTNPRMAICKRRSGANGVEIPFRTRVVPISEDDPLKDTLIIDWQPEREGIGATVKKDRWAKSLLHLRKIVVNLLCDLGQDIRPFPDGPTVRAIQIDAVRAEFYKSHLAQGDSEKTKQASRRQAFHRAIQKAQEKELIALRNINGVEFIWLGTAEQETSQPDGEEA